MSLTPLPALDQLAADPGRAGALSLEATEKLLAQAHVVQGALLARLLAARSQGDGQPEAPDRLLTVKDAARTLACSTDHLYRHASTYPFTVRLGSRLRFSARGIERYIRQRQGR